MQRMFIRWLPVRSGGRRRGLCDILGWQNPFIGASALVKDEFCLEVFMRLALFVCSLSVYVFCTTAYSAQAASYTLLYSFRGGADGSGPTASLIDVKGTLYGTTERGGVVNCTYVGNSVGCGTVYSITPAGQETVVYRFQE